MRPENILMPLFYTSNNYWLIGIENRFKDFVFTTEKDEQNYYQFVISQKRV